MTIVDVDKFLSYLIFSKHIDDLTCGEVKEAIEMCKVDILEKIRAEIIENAKRTMNDTRVEGLYMALNIVDKYRNNT